MMATKTIKNTNKGIAVKSSNPSKRIVNSADIGIKTVKSHRVK